MTAVAKLDEIMEKAQEFASTWSLVGGKFDDGTLFATSQERKEELRALVRAALSPAELGGVDYRKIAHEIYCHVGQCHGEPMCFLAEDEGIQAQWIDAVQTVLTHHISTPRAAEAVTEYRWRSVSDDLPERTGWYIGINYGVVEPLRWDGNNWHHTRVTRDLAMPSHWRPLPAPPSAKGE